MFKDIIILGMVILVVVLLLFFVILKMKIFIFDDFVVIGLGLYV